VVGTPFAAELAVGEPDGLPDPPLPPELELPHPAMARAAIAAAIAGHLIRVIIAELLRVAGFAGWG
jgi:hypothetical protein